MSPYTLGRAACVCRKWKYTIRNPVYWRNACLKAWQVTCFGSEHIAIVFRLLSYHLNDWIALSEALRSCGKL